MPFKGFCIICNTEISAETKPEFGEALIAHHKSWQERSMGYIEDRCNVFQAVETDAEGKVVGEPFGLDTTMEIVCRSWTGFLWYEGKSRGTERD